MRDLIEQASDISVYVSGSGVVQGISVNPESPSLGCLDHWVGHPFSEFLAHESQEKFSARVSELHANLDAAPRPLELNHIDSAAWEFPIKYTMHVAQEEDGAVLLLGRDMQPIAEVQQRLVAEQQARERDQQKLRSEETFYRVVLEASATPLILVDPEQGRIRDLNSAAGTLLGAKPETISGSAFAQAFEGRRRGEFLEELQAVAGADEAGFVNVVARRSGRRISLSPEFFRAAGELCLLCRIDTDEDEDAATLHVANAMSSLFAATSDAIVITDSTGVIRDANEAFLIMADAAQLKDVRDLSLADFLVRGSVDLKLILESAGKKGRLSNYSAKFKSIVGTRLSADLSAAKLRQKVGDPGFGMIIRSVTPAADPGESEPGSVMSDDAMKSVMDLVGTASLKELVSATADVIEKMCIETAVQLTNNNRVAAAEMLGLSRQSLYVKLRKHGLLSRNPEE
ncbi:MAG: transcriptional regulator PpsR [Roseovarius sp.]